jgi:hypothetical protein
LLRTPLSDGFVERSGLGDPVINDAGVTALYGYAYLADTSGVYLLPNHRAEINDEGTVAFLLPTTPEAAGSSPRPTSS